MTMPTPTLPPVVDEPTTLPGRFLAGIPRWSASRPHIWLMVALWVVLVPVTLIWPHLLPLTWQLALGNHTNVISATGASIAAGSTLAVHGEVRKRRVVEEARHELAEATHAMIADLHARHAGPADGVKGP